MKLIGRTVSPYTRRLAIAMRLWGMRYEHEPVPLVEQARLRRYNPLGRIPALVLDDGETLIDSRAILDTLAEMAGPDQSMLPLSGLERRRVLQADALICGVLEKAVAAFYESARKAEDKRDMDWRESQLDQARSGLAALETRGPDSWLCGFGPTIADITVATTFDFVGATLSGALDLSAWPALGRTAAAVRALPAYEETAP